MPPDFADEPKVGTYYRTDAGIVVEVLETQPNGRWLGRFVNNGSAGHRQWQPWWAQDWFSPVPAMPDQGAPCRCGACTRKDVVVVVAAGSP